jgi:hypothetical protein
MGPMVNQGRLVRVMFVLVAAMTTGALVLLALEGKPIKPMAFSLSSQTRLSSFSSLNAILDTDTALKSGHWQRIELSYQPNNGQLSGSLGLTGELARQYHFVISDGSAGHDGDVYTSQWWLNQKPCYQASGAVDSQGLIKICLISSPDHPKGSPWQARKLETLVSGLIKRCQLSQYSVVSAK